MLDLICGQQVMRKRSKHWLDVSHRSVTQFSAGDRSLYARDQGLLGLARKQYEATLTFMPILSVTRTRHSNKPLLSVSGSPQSTYKLGYLTLQNIRTGPKYLTTEYSTRYQARTARHHISIGGIIPSGVCVLHLVAQNDQLGRFHTVDRAVPGSWRSSPAAPSSVLTNLDK